SPIFREPYLDAARRGKGAKGRLSRVARAANPGQAAALARGGPQRLSNKAASATSPRSIRRCPPARGAWPRKPAARKSRPAVASLRMRNFGVCWQKEIRYFTENRLVSSVAAVFAERATTSAFAALADVLAHCGK